MHFHLFEFYHIDTIIKESSSFWISLLITFSGTALGFLGAFYLTKFTEIKQKKNQMEVQKEGYRKRLKYFIKLIEASIEIIKKQLNNFEKLTVEIKESPVEQHLLGKIASNDLKRLQGMDTEEIFHAYQIIVPENEDKDKDYKNIYSKIDFLYMRFEQALDQQDKRVSYIYRDQLYIKEIVETLASEIYRYIKDIEFKIPKFEEFPQYIFLLHSHKIYMDLSVNQSKVSEYEDGFLIPFAKELNESFKREYFFSDLNILSTKAVIKFNDVKMNSARFIAEILDIRKEMNDPIDKLNAIKEKLNLFINTEDKNKIARSGFFHFFSNCF